jgi:hypothetical protein
MKTSLGICLATAALAVGLSGCAAHTMKPFDSHSAWPPGQGAAVSVIGVRVYGETFLNDREEGLSLADLRLWQEQTAKAYGESGLFAGVESSSIEADPETGVPVGSDAGIGDVDLHADVQIIERQQVNWTMAVITGVTAYIIPSKVTSDVTVKTTIRDNKGKVLGEFTTSNSVVTWQQIVLIVAMPFQYPSTVERQAIFDLNRLALIEMNDKGVLVPAPAAKAP